MRFIVFALLFVFFVEGCTPAPRDRNIEWQALSIVGGKAKADLDLRTLNRRARRQFDGLALIGIAQEEIRECTVAYVMNDGCCMTLWRILRKSLCGHSTVNLFAICQL